MPKLQKQSAGKVKGKEYVKWVITLPAKQVEKAGFVEGENLIAISFNPHQMFLSSERAFNLLVAGKKKGKLTKAEKEYKKAFEAYTRERLNNVFE